MYDDGEVVIQAIQDVPERFLNRDIRLPRATPYQRHAGFKDTSLEQQASVG